MKRLLLVAYGFPPRGGPAVQRPLKLAKYLGRFGWQTTVLTIADPPGALMDPGLLAEVPEDVEVVRTWSLEPTRLLQALRRGRNAPEVARPEAVSAGGFSGRSPAFIRFVQAFFVPDEKRYWSLHAIPAALRHAAEHPVDAVLSTGPPHSSHLIGSRLASKLGVPHVVDLRDPWVGNQFFIPPTPVHAWLQRRYERRTLASADAVVATAPSVAREIAERLGHPRALAITNGFDPDDLPDEVVPPDRFTLVHTGTFSGSRTPRWLLQGLALAEAERSGLIEQAQMRFVGVGSDVEQMARDEGVRGLVSGVGYVPHDESLRELAGASVAVVVLAAGRESDITVPGKLFEYIGVRRPILALVGPGDAADILSRVPGVSIVEPESAEAIGRAIVELFDAWREDRLTVPSPEDSARFSRIEIAREYANLLEEVTGRA